MIDVFHQGELAAQAKAGVSAQAQNVGRIIHPALPQGADGYLATLPILLQGAPDADGEVWASALTGDPGFIRAVDPGTVLVRADPAHHDPISTAGQQDTPAGFLAIDLATRQRFRFNGRATRDAETLHVHVEQAYGNCPKYIQLRQVTVHDSPPHAGPATVRSNLTEDDTELIRRADTFFIASAAAGHGTDVSHRGGSPGFVRVSPDGGLSFDDYPGNNMFQTLGNLASDPRAGLLFIDFESGTTLQLTGRAEVVWSDGPPRDHADTGRSVTFTPHRVIHTPQGVPLRWLLEAYSPYNPEVKAG